MIYSGNKGYKLSTTTDDFRTSFRAWRKKPCMKGGHHHRRNHEKLPDAIWAYNGWKSLESED